MKKLIIGCGTFFLVSAIHAQAVDDLKNLKTPNSPGFQLLDIAPSSIERPTNPKAFAVSVYNLTSNGTVVPKNFAFEIAPYWYIKSKNNSLYSFLNIADTNAATKSTNRFSGIYNRLSISIASSFSDSSSGSLLKNTNYLAVGLRTNLYTYRTDRQNAKMTSAFTNINIRISELSKVNSRKRLQMDGLKKATENLIKTEQRKRDRETQIVDSLVAEQSNADSLKINSLKESIEARNARIAELNIKQSETEIAIAKSKSTDVDDLEKSWKADTAVVANMKTLESLPAFQLDAAFAYSEAMQDNVYANKRFNRWGAWLTGTGAIGNIFSISAALKYMNDNLLVDTVKNSFLRSGIVDVGVKMELILKDLSFSVEYINRNYLDIGLPYGERTVGQIQYKLSDGVYLTGSFGKNFGNQKNVFTLLGVNWNIGKL